MRLVAHFNCSIGQFAFHSGSLWAGCTLLLDECAMFAPNTHPMPSLACCQRVIMTCLLPSWCLLCANVCTAAKNGCTACGCEDGCVLRQWAQCECAFHTQTDERLLNRVVRRAVVTPNFMAGFK
jgi:hypothetical protein